MKLQVMESTVPAPAPAAPDHALGPRPLVAPKSVVGGSTLDSPATAPPPAPGSKLDVQSSAFEVQPLADPQPSSLNPRPSFPRSPGETPRAFSAFMAFFNLGHNRSLPAVADQLNEKLDSIRKWSSRFRWFHRIQTFNSGLLQQQAEAEAALRAESAADWARRTKNYREHEWDTAQKLLGAVQCFLESFGDRDVEKMTLAQVSRAFAISSRIARQALSGAAVPEGPVRVPLQAELSAALKKAYATPTEVGPGSPLPAAAAPATNGVSPAGPSPSTLSFQPSTSR